ncbi:unnamed protein product, partial [Closterium sp. NIES-54]
MGATSPGAPPAAATGRAVLSERVVGHRMALQRNENIRCLAALALPLPLPAPGAPHLPPDAAVQSSADPSAFATSRLSSGSSSSSSSGSSANTNVSGGSGNSGSVRMSSSVFVGTSAGRVLHLSLSHPHTTQPNQPGAPAAAEPASASAHTGTSGSDPAAAAAAAGAVSAGSSASAWGWLTAGRMGSASASTATAAAAGDSPSAAGSRAGSVGGAGSTGMGGAGGSDARGPELTMRGVCVVGRRAVERVEVLHTVMGGLLAVLCDGGVRLLHPLSLSLGPPVGPATGTLLLASHPLSSPTTFPLSSSNPPSSNLSASTSASSFPASPPPSAPLLLVLRRKLLIFTISSSAPFSPTPLWDALSIRLQGEMLIKGIGEREVPLAAAYLGSSVILGTSLQYLHVSIPSGQPLQLFPLPPSSPTPPLIAAVSLAYNASGVSSPRERKVAPDEGGVASGMRGEAGGGEGEVTPAARTGAGAVRGSVAEEGGWGLQQGALQRRSVGVEVTSDLRAHTQGTAHTALPPPSEAAAVAGGETAVTAAAAGRSSGSGMGASEGRPSMQSQESAAVLAMDDIGVVIDTTGQPRGNPLIFPSPPIALTFAPPHVATALHHSLHLFDPATGTLLQTLPVPGGVGTAGRSPLVALAAERGGGGAVVAASGSEVWWVPRLSLVQQARELMREKRYGEALEVARGLDVGEEMEGGEWREVRPGDGAEPSTGKADAASAVTGAAAVAAAKGVVSPMASAPELGSRNVTIQGVWRRRVAEAHAQVGLLLLWDGDFKAAVPHLLAARGGVFQPAEIFALFPHLTARWRSLVGRSSPFPRPLFLVPYSSSPVPRLLFLILHSSPPLLSHSSRVPTFFVCSTPRLPCSQRHRTWQ